MGGTSKRSTSTSVGLPWLLSSSRPSETRPLVGQKVVQGGRVQPKISKASILSAIANPNSNPKQVISLFTTVTRQRGFRHVIPIFITLIPFLVRHRRIRAAEVLLRRLSITEQCPGPSLLLPLASSALSSGIPYHSAPSLLLSAHPSASAFSSLLRALLRLGHLSLARSLILSADPQDLGFQIKGLHFAGLVREYCRRGNFVEAKELLMQMAQKGVVMDVEACNRIALQIL